ncbi:MAG: hypothetical protein JRI68_24335 [Deltaproteobacteria bacterium]|nr:hypothetical protein [Deltaproteobacteria bacterium]
MSLHRLIAPLVLAATLASAPLRAEVDPQALFTEARAHYQAGEYEAALAGFEKALAASGSPNARLYLARCLRELGRLGEAYNQLITARAEAAARATEEDHYTTTRDVADVELRQLEPRIAKLVITVPASVKGVTVTIDGATIDSARLGEALPLAPGEHELVATAPGRESVRATVVLNAGRTKSVPVFVTAGPPRQPPKTEPEPADDGSSLRATSFVVGGVGLMGVALGAAFGAAAMAKKSDVEDNCDGTACTPEGVDAATDGNLFGNVSTAGFVIGGVALATGLTLFLLSGDDEDDSPGESAPAQAYWHPRRPLTIVW